MTNLEIARANLAHAITNLKQTVGNRSVINLQNEALIIRSNPATIEIQMAPDQTYIAVARFNHATETWEELDTLIVQVPGYYQRYTRTEIVNGPVGFTPIYPRATTWCSTKSGRLLAVRLEYSAIYYKTEIRDRVPKWSYTNAPPELSARYEFLPTHPTTVLLKASQLLTDIADLLSDLVTDLRAVAQAEVATTA